MDIQTDDEWDEAEKGAIAVSLRSVVERDKTLNEVFNLDYGEFADRSEIGEKWKRDVIQDEEEGD